MKHEFSATITVKTEDKEFTPHIVETLNADNLIQLSSLICLCLIRISEQLNEKELQRLRDKINFGPNWRDDDIPF